MPIRDNDPRPAYEQLADELRHAIATEQLRPNDRLPSTRQLSDEYGIAPMTVRHALQTLEDEGLIVARQGRGVFVHPDAPTQTTGGDVKDVLDDARRMLDEARTRLDTQPDAKDALDRAMEHLMAAHALLDAVDPHQAPEPDIGPPELEPPPPAPDVGP